MRDPIASALRTARGYGRRYAEGGDIPEPMPAPDPVPEASVPQDDPAALAYSKIAAPTKPTIMEPDLQALQTGQMPEGLDTEKYGVDELGRVVDKKTFEPIQLTRRPNVLPFTKTPEGGMEFAMPKIADIAGNMGAGWSVPVQGAEHILGAGLVVPKAVKAAEKKGILDLHPSEVNGWLQEPNSQLGSNPGSMFHDNQGKSWYIKQPPSDEHAKIEKLASELYKEAGVPAADVHLTEMDGRLAVASPIIPGKTLNKYGEEQYGAIKDLHGGFPADAWLANYDSVGTGKDNIVINNGVAHRIDMGGSLIYRAQGKPKEFGPHVGEFESMTQPGYDGLKNYDAASVFGQKTTPQTMAAQQATAQRIADISPQRIKDLVSQYGPDSSYERTKLFNNLLLRRDQIAKRYGVKPQIENEAANVVPLKPKEQTLDELQAEWEEKLAKYEAKVDEPRLYEPAEEPRQYKPVYGDNARTTEPTFPASQPAMREGNAPGGSLKLMELNYTHNVGQIVNAIKPYQKAEINVGKTVTAKQKDKIAEMIAAAPNMQVATAVKKLQPDEINNVLSWLPPAKAANVKHLAKVDPEKVSQIIPDIDKVKKGHSLYQMIGAIKNYLPTQSEVPYHAYQSIPKELSKWSPHEIKQEMENLSLTQKENVLKWLPESTIEKMEQIAQANAANKKTFIEQEYYDALKPVDWQSYKPKGATSVRDQIGKKTLKEALAQGYNPDVALFKGGKHHGTYPSEVVDPVTESHKLSNPNERAFFLSDKTVHTEPYGQLGGEYIARPEKVYSVDWQDLTGTEDYAAHHMRRIIEAAREQGADLVIVKGVHDTSGYGHAAQDQYAFLNTHVLRGPKAEFDPNKLHLRHPLAGLVGGGLFSYGMLRGQEDKEQRYAKGGVVKVPKASVNYSKGMEKSHCGICQFYHAKTCSKVQGPIDWSFWCRFFKEK